jgi:flagellar FliJ protein
MFRFRLEKVLRHRERREDEEARALRRAVEALRRARERRIAQERFLARLEQDGGAGRLAGADVALRSLLAEFLAVQGEKWRALAQRERELAAAEAAQRARLVAAHRDREVLERLRERQREAWEDEERRRERRAMDEVAARRARGGPQPDLP